MRWSRTSSSSRWVIRGQWLLTAIDALCEQCQWAGLVEVRAGATAGVTPKEPPPCQARMLSCQVTQPCLGQACVDCVRLTVENWLLPGCRAPWWSSGTRAPRAAPACLRC